MKACWVSHFRRYWGLGGCTGLQYCSDTEHMRRVKTQQSIGITPGVCEVPNLGYVIAVCTPGAQSTAYLSTKSYPTPWATDASMTPMPML